MIVENEIPLGLWPFRSEAENFLDMQIVKVAERFHGFLSVSANEPYTLAEVKTFLKEYVKISRSLSRPYVPSDAEIWIARYRMKGWDEADASNLLERFHSALSLLNIPIEISNPSAVIPDMNSIPSPLDTLTSSVAWYGGALVAIVVLAANAKKLFGSEK